MSAKVYMTTLSAKGLAVLIVWLRPKALYAILERPDRIEFPSAAEPITVATWPVGRVFGPEVELYWEQEGKTYRARLTCTDGATPPARFQEVLSLEGSEIKPTWYYLWGEDEVAIGGRLDYSRAIPGPGRGQLGVVEHRDTAGRLVFYRYVGLRREVEHDR